jgi:hypothetical protein
MSSKEDIQDLVQQWQDFQLQQTVLLSRLARASLGEANAQRNNIVPPDEPRALVIGSRGYGFSTRDVYKQTEE